MAEYVVDIDRFHPNEWRHAKEELRLQLFDLEDGSHFSLPCGVVAGRKGGPIVTVVAGQHGDEWNGVYLCHQLFRQIEPRDLNGVLVILPVANPWAFIEKRRISAVDSVDMNRCYSFIKSRKPTERVAGLLFESIYSKSNYLLDIHTGGSGEYLQNIGITEQGRVGLALSLNSGYVIIADRDHGSLVPACERSSIAAFSVEIGRGLTVDFDRCDLFLNEGILNFLKKVKLLAGEVLTESDQELFTEKSMISAPVSGFFRSAVKLGQSIEAGRRIGEIIPLFSSKPVAITTPDNGVILYLRREEKVSTGDSLVHLAFSRSAGER